MPEKVSAHEGHSGGNEERGPDASGACVSVLRQVGQYGQVNGKRQAVRQRLCRLAGSGAKRALRARVCESARQAAVWHVQRAGAPRARAASISFQRAPARTRAARARRRPSRPHQERPRSSRWAPQASRRAAAELTCRRRTPLRPPLQAAARLCPPPWKGRGRRDGAAAARDSTALLARRTRHISAWHGVCCVRWC